MSFLKNQTPSPSEADQDAVGPTLKTLADLQQLDGKAATIGLQKQHQADFAQDLAEIGQGSIRTVIGYLYYAIPGGIETCNCKLTNPNDRDFHLGIGFDADVAKEVRNGTISFRGTDATAKKDLQQTSIIVEMTPHYRNNFHPTWTLPLVQDVEGQQVKIVGQLLIDNEHNEPQQNCAFIDADSTTCWRGSAWEIHPITRFFVCRTGNCTDGSPDWVELENR